MKVPRSLNVPALEHAERTGETLADRAADGRRQKSHVRGDERESVGHHRRVALRRVMF